MSSAPSLSEFPCSSSSGPSLSLLPAEPTAQVGVLDDCAPLEKRIGRSMASKTIINFVLQGAVWCERSHIPHQASEFPCSSSSGSPLSLLPAAPSATLLQVRVLDDGAPLERSSGTSMAAKMIINFGLQGAAWCERCCTLPQAFLNFRVHRFRALR